jgi:hypothetical protein
MNTGSPRILHSRRWERFGRSINTIVDALDSWTINSAPEATPDRAPVEHQLKVAGQEEPL